MARIYRVSQIRNAVVGDVRFDRPPHFDLATFWTHESQRFEASLRVLPVTLEATSAGLARLARVGGYAAAAVRQALPPGPDGWASVSLSIEQVDQAALLLLGLGPEVRVVDPPALRNRVHALARETARLHSSPDDEPA